MEEIVLEIEPKNDFTIIPKIFADLCSDDDSLCSIIFSSYHLEKQGVTSSQFAHMLLTGKEVDDLIAALQTVKDNLKQEADNA